MLQFIFKMQWTFHWWFCLSIKPYGLAWRFYFFAHLVGKILRNFICFVYDVGCVPKNVFYWVLFRFTHFKTFCSSLVETQSSTKQSRVRHINHSSVHDLWTSKYNIFPFLSPCAVSCVAVVSVNWFDFMVFSDCLTCSRLNFGVGTVAWTLQVLCALSIRMPTSKKWNFGNFTKGLCNTLVATGPGASSFDRRHNFISDALIDVTLSSRRYIVRWAFIVVFVPLGVSIHLIMICKTTRFSLLWLPGSWPFNYLLSSCQTRKWQTVAYQHHEQLSN